MVSAGDEAKCANGNSENMKFVLEVVSYYLVLACFAKKDTQVVAFVSWKRQVMGMLLVRARRALGGAVFAADTPSKTAQGAELCPGHGGFKRDVFCGFMIKLAAVEPCSGHVACVGGWIRCTSIYMD